MAISEVVDRLERAWYPAEQHFWTPTFSAYVPLEMHEFIAGLAICGQHTGGQRLLDIGSGIGTKLLTARLLGWQADGIEFYEPYVATSRHLCPEAPVVVADARRYHAYAEYDVLYAYRPVTDPQGNDELEDFIYAAATSGTVLWFPHRQRDHDWIALDRRYGIWRKP